MRRLSHASLAAFVAVTGLMVVATLKGADGILGVCWDDGGAVFSLRIYSVKLQCAGDGAPRWQCGHGVLGGGLRVYGARRTLRRRYRSAVRRHAVTTVAGATGLSCWLSSSSSGWRAARIVSLEPTVATAAGAAPSGFAHARARSLRKRERRPRRTRIIDVFSRAGAPADAADAESRTRVARPNANFGFLNPPVFRGSTVLFPTAEKFLKGDQPYTYGRKSTPTVRALEDAIAAIEGGAACVLTGVGLSGRQHRDPRPFLKAGDHVLMVDNVYAPTRHFCDGMLGQVRRRDDLLRSDDRRRHRQADPAQHQGGLSRGAGLADLRGAGRRRHRRGRQEARRRGADRQYLGDAALLQAVRPRLRPLDPRRRPSTSSAIPTR